ncbi:MAG: hypothetical protein FJ286_10040 [Planctomycetes bacterium]|nr:hypothetical protein [Planctomycetota bacterium]
MTLAEAISTVAVAGCRLVPDDAGGVALVVPDGKTIPRAVLDVLRAHREQLGAAHARPTPPALAVPAEDLAEYLAEKGLPAATAELVVYAARLFEVPGQAITIERVVAASETELFEPGIPMRTTEDIEWHKPGAGYFTVPAGTVGLLVPQLWAIGNEHARAGIESTVAAAKRRGLPLHVPVWLAGEPRAIGMDAITLEGVAVPPGMDLTPWRSQRREVAA